MALTDWLISWWELDESSWTRYDSYWTNHLTAYNSPTNTTGVIWNWVNLNWVNQYLWVADNASLSPTSEMSVSFWTRMDTLVNLWALVSKWDETWNQRTFGVAIDSSKFKFWISDDWTNFDSLAHSWTASTGTLYHAVATYKNWTNWIKIYVNNSVAQTSPSNATSVYNSTANFNIWRADTFGGATYYVDWMIDLVWYWNRELTSTEVSELYNWWAWYSPFWKKSWFFAFFQ